MTTENHHKTFILKGAMKFMETCIFYQAYSHDFSALFKVAAAAAVELVVLLTYLKKERKRERKYH